MPEVAPFGPSNQRQPLARKTEAVVPHDSPKGIGRSRRRPRSRSRSPETPMPSSLDQAFSRHRLTLHSRAMAQFDDTEAELTKEVKASIKASQNAIFALDAKHRELTTPLAQVQASRTSRHPDGSEHHDVVTLGDAIAQLQNRIEESKAELSRVWES